MIDESGPSNDGHTNGPDMGHEGGAHRRPDDVPRPSRSRGEAPNTGREAGLQYSPEDFASGQEAARQAAEGNLDEALKHVTGPKDTDYDEVLIHLNNLHEQDAKPSDEQLASTAAAFINSGLSQEDASIALSGVSMDEADKKKILELIPKRTEKQKSEKNDKTDEENAAEAHRQRGQAEGMMASAGGMLANLEQQAEKEKDPKIKRMLEEQAHRFKHKIGHISKEIGEWMDVEPKEWGRRAYKFAVVASILALVFILWEMQMIGKMSKK